MTTSPVYDTIGQAYVAHRRPDPRWEALVAEQIGEARVVVNVGAGTGSYEPADNDPDPDPDADRHRTVVAIEPSSVMVAQRPSGAAPAVRASASALPLPTGWADVALGVCTVHHWDDWKAGLAEMQRVARRQVILAIDFDLHGTFWLLEDYLPEVGDHTRRCHPGADLIAEAIGATDVITLPVPRDMQDGVLGAYWCRPEAYLDPAVRANASGLALADPAVIARGVGELERDLGSGAWQRRHADLLAQESVDLGYRLVVAEAR
ncbi:MAG TPA: methyltransferase domain-containing protein [Acidimicrobiales bacterium]|nr:methyltransferase domain-containing protein [Acidimicrobiales bacterium]